MSQQELIDELLDLFGDDANIIDENVTNQDDWDREYWSDDGEE